MIIKVKGFLTYRDLIGKRAIERPDNGRVTLLEFIHELAAELGGQQGRALFDTESETIGQSVAILLNGVHYNHLPERINTVLKDQDEVAIFPPGAGG